MKLQILLPLTLILLSVGSEVYGQTKAIPRIDMGFTVSFFDAENPPNEDPSLVEEFEKTTRVAFEMGYGYDIFFNNALSMYGGLFYSEKGGAYRTQNPDFVYVNQFSGQQVDDAYNYIRYRLAYLEVPVLLKYNFFDALTLQDDEMFLNLFVGLSPMLNVGSKLRYNVFEGSTEADERWESEKREGAEPFVLAWNAGVEWRGGPLVLYGRYSANITDVYDTSKAGFENYDVNMSTISLGMAFLLKY